MDETYRRNASQRQRGNYTTNSTNDEAYTPFRSGVSRREYESVMTFENAAVQDGPSVPGGPVVSSPHAQPPGMTTLDYSGPSSDNYANLKLSDLTDPLPGRPPDYPMHVLMQVAIQSSATGYLRQSEIRDALIERFPYYATAGKTWRNTLRHALTNRRSFFRVKKPANVPGRGSFWGYQWAREPKRKNRPNPKRDARAPYSTTKRKMRRDPEEDEDDDDYEGSDEEPKHAPQHHQSRAGPVRTSAAATRTLPGPLTAVPSSPGLFVSSPNHVPLHTQLPHPTPPATASREPHSSHQIFYSPPTALARPTPTYPSGVPMGLSYIPPDTVEDVDPYSAGPSAVPDGVSGLHYTQSFDVNDSWLLQNETARYFYGNSNTQPPADNQAVTYDEYRRMAHGGGDSQTSHTQGFGPMFPPSHAMPPFFNSYPTMEHTHIHPPRTHSQGITADGADSEDGMQSDYGFSPQSLQLPSLSTSSSSFSSGPDVSPPTAYGFTALIELFDADATLFPLFAPAAAAAKAVAQ